MAAQLYQSMISQQLYLKTMIEAWRTTNVWLSIWWMYNELWPTVRRTIIAGIWVAFFQYRSNQQYHVADRLRSCCRRSVASAR